MKNFFKSFFVVAFAFAMLTGLFFARPTKNQEEANAYVIETNDSDFLLSLLNSSETLGTSYDMSKIYPLVCENQTTSDFCWLYASSKALETALMVQRQEYYNVSEVGMGYLYYVDRLAAGAEQEATLSIGGNFYNFIDLYQSHGIIPESDVSNDIYGLAQKGQINSSNYESYRYIADYADQSFFYEDATGVNSYANAYNMSEHIAMLTNAERIKVIKAFIQNYGGLFAGIEHGVFYKDNDSICYFTSDLSQQGYGTVTIPKGGAHAVTLIGWDDNIVIDGNKGAFLAMNSWGLGTTDYEYFYVSYKYNADVDFTNEQTGVTTTVNIDLFDALYGFVFDEVEERVEVVGTTASDFKKTFYSSSDLENVFTYGDKRIAVEYELAVSSLDTITVKVSNGKTDLTGKFTTDYSNATKTIRLTLNDKNSFYGGLYSVKFYQNGRLFATKALYIVSGTESGYFMVEDEYHNLDSYALNNTFLSMNNNTTLYLSSKKSQYTILFNLTPINEWNRLGKDFNLSISNASIRSNDASLSSLSSNNIISTYFYLGTDGTYHTSNSYTIELSHLSGLANSMLSFSVNFESMVFSGVTRTYYFDIFFSPNNVTTRGSYVINYELDGGNNSNENVLRMPDYGLDASMVDYPLANPTKQGANFLGWYLNPEFTGGTVSMINSALLGNARNGAVTLYAKWDSADVEYFDIGFKLVGATDYYGEDKPIDGEFVYGDSLEYQLTIDALAGLLALDEYTIHYYFYVNGVPGDEIPLSKGSHTISILVGFPEIKSGVYEFGVRVVVMIAGEYHIKTDTLDIQIGKKLVEFEFSDLNQPYEGIGYYPTVTVKNGSFYAEDLVGKEIADLFNMSDDIPRVNAGTYEFYVDSLNNENYYFVAQDAICELVISKRLVTVTWDTSFTATYDANTHIPNCVIGNVIEGDTVTFALTGSNFVNAGIHEINIIPETISNPNYYVVLGENFEFEINKSKITIVMSGAKDRFQTPVEHRAAVSYQIFGVVHQNSLGQEDDLGITVINNADYATKSGKYLVTCTISNANYEATVQNSTYELTGVYRVTYHMPDGTIIHEDVEEGMLPLGLQDKVDLPMFNRIIYSEVLSGITKDTHVSVEIEDYSGTVYLIGFVILFIVVCVIYYFKKRGNGVR